MSGILQNRKPYPHPHPHLNQDKCTKPVWTPTEDYRMGMSQPLGSVIQGSLNQRQHLLRQVGATPWEAMPDEVVFKASEVARADLVF